MAADNMKGMFDRTLRNKIRMGNFESTEQDMLCLRSLFQFPSKPFSVADFCAGSGRALEVLTQETAAVTFGIEPNEEKYLQMRDRLSHALYGGYEECRISRDTFRLFYLNPPYDTDSNTVEDKTERKEKRFLRHLLLYVSVDGLLVYNIPRGRMTSDIVKMLVANLDDIRVYQSHDDTYHQIYAIGRKRKEKFLDRNEVERILGLLEEGSDLQRLPLLDDPIYKVSPGNVTPKLFRSNRIDVDQLREIVHHSALHQKGKEWSTPKPPALRLQPLLPDKEMHRVLRMASGRLNGKVGKGNLLHVLKGIVKKEVVTSVEETESEIIQSDRDTFRISFKMVDRYGNMRKLEN
ncbi:DUF6094 domain-containing protein [Paenibacillus sp. MMO-58]|uniref:DUF6094 domain-containing protein n=1 Tax=Paenibacillus sp. MMO-58 TaxID=3081290 RepID=UPI00301AE267